MTEISPAALDTISRIAAQNDRWWIAGLIFALLAFGLAVIYWLVKQNERLTDKLAENSAADQRIKEKLIVVLEHNNQYLHILNTLLAQLNQTGLIRLPPAPPPNGTI